MAKQTLGIEWPVDLHFRPGPPSMLSGIHIFHDFDWYNEFGHDKSTFPNGKKLSQLVRKECPSGKTPTLLLTLAEGHTFAVEHTDAPLIYIIHIREYKQRAKSDAALTFCAQALNASFSSLLEVAGTSLSSEQRKDLLGTLLTPEALKELAQESPEKQAIVASVARELLGIDPDTDTSAQLLADLDNTSAVDADLLDALTGLFQRIATGEVFSERDPATSVSRLIQTFTASRGLPEIIDYISKNQLAEADLEQAVLSRNRAKALEEYRAGLASDELEGFWQKWFQRNHWVLGSECVRILDSQTIDTSNIADYLVEAYDGHVDIVEIKRPSAMFWASQKDHDNWIPHQDLVKALTQAENYQFELEREMDSKKWSERVAGTPIAKPRALLIHGRSEDWDEDKRRAQRLLNGSLSSITVLTYDQVLARAERMLERNTKDSDQTQDELPERFAYLDIPDTFGEEHDPLVDFDE